MIPIRKLLITKITLLVLAITGCFTMYGLFFTYRHGQSYHYTVYSNVFFCCFVFLLLLGSHHSYQGFGLMAFSSSRHPATGLLNATLILAVVVHAYFLIAAFFSRAQLQ